MHELLPTDIEQQIPELYSQEHEKDPTAYVKFEAPGQPMAWFVTEIDHQDKDTCFGYAIDGYDGEFTYFSLSLIQGRGPSSGFISYNEQGQPTEARTFGQMPFVKRDISFTPCLLSQAIAEYRKQYES